MINKKFLDFLYDQKHESVEARKDWNNINDFASEHDEDIHIKVLRGMDIKITFIDTVISEYLLTDKE